MSHHSIYLFQSETTHDEEGTDPMDNVETALEDVLEDEAGEDAFVITRDVQIPAPTEDLDESIFTSISPYFPDPPNPDDSYKMYDYLLDWWRDYAEYQLPDWKIGDDSNLLLTHDTDESVVGRAGTGDSANFATAATGSDCAGFDWAENSGESEYQDDSAGYSGVETAIHEVGHNILEYQGTGGGPDCDGGSGQHLMGNASLYDEAGFWWWEEDEYAGTPMSESYFGCMADGGENHCGNDVTDGVDSVSAIDLRLSECAQSNIRDPL